mmetsp:Transcript_14406/g.16359  ORF Transcript_14406/g.16359 Transcript_14406/m.16359 type:complete len:264 (+) Transcript_14406:163-954(+)
MDRKITSSTNLYLSFKPPFKVSGVYPSDWLLGEKPPCSEEIFYRVKTWVESKLPNYLEGVELESMREHDESNKGFCLSLSLAISFISAGLVLDSLSMLVTGILCSFAACFFECRNNKSWNGTLLGLAWSHWCFSIVCGIALMWLGSKRDKMGMFIGGIVYFTLGCFSTLILPSGSMIQTEEEQELILTTLTELKFLEDLRVVLHIEDPDCDIEMTRMHERSYLKLCLSVIPQEHMETADQIPKVVIEAEPVGQVVVAAVKDIV